MQITLPVPPGRSPVYMLRHQLYPVYTSTTVATARYCLMINESVISPSSSLVASCTHQVSPIYLPDPYGTAAIQWLCRREDTVVSLLPRD